MRSNQNHSIPFKFITIKYSVIMMVFMVLCQARVTAQYTLEQCQSNADALIATDRNDWAHTNLAVVNEGYLHNFEPPEPPCGLENASLTSVQITIELEDINNIAPCSGLPVFGNVLLNCALTTNSVCGIVQDVLSSGCAFGAGQGNVGTYSLTLNNCGINAQINDVIGVDLIPATEIMDSCPTIANAISNGSVSLEYTICVTYTYNQDAPEACENTISLPCNDGDDCTINDTVLVDDCDNTIICVPCAGESIATCDDTVVLPCDDGNDCTINDMETVSDCDNTFVCVPCSGELVVDCNMTIDLPCNDGDPCTENDIETVSACDNTFVCVPCQGVPAEVCSNTIALPCDDGDDCTQNDVEQVDACDNTIVCIPCAGEFTPTCDDTVTLPCNDGNDCTINDMETVSVCDNTFVCVPCSGEVVVDCDSTIELPCDDGDPCTENDMETVSACDNTFVCVPCLGVPVGECTNTISLPCDDGNDCTENDLEWIDACDNSVVCIPCAGTPTPPQNCDDGNCQNGIEFWDTESCSCLSEQTILGCTDLLSCNYDSSANCDFECDYSCLDCLGVPDGFASIDSCGVCLGPEDPLRNITCIDQIYIPNSFTPDGDGLNEYFSINTARAFDSFELIIFNRFGQEVFYTTDPKFRWLGDVNGGDHYGMNEIYIYKLHYSFVAPLVEEKTGTVTLLR